MDRAERRRRQKLADKKARKAQSTQQTGVGGATRQLLEQAIRLHRQGALAQAEAHYHAILSAEPQHPVALHMLGLVALQSGNHELALELISRAVALQPDYAAAHADLGIACKRVGRLGEAIASYRRAIAIQPDIAVVHTNLGIALKEAGQVPEAIASYRRAIALQPDYLDAHFNLAELLEKSNQIEALRKAVLDGYQRFPGHPLITLWEARLLKREGDFSAARDLLASMDVSSLDPKNSRLRSQLLGQVCDRLHDPEAFRHFEESNRWAAKVTSADKYNKERYRERLQRYARQFTPDWCSGWTAVSVDDDRIDPVFLVGFPRSGTTLLDTILRSHPRITVVEESAAVDNIRLALEAMPGGDPQALATLDSGKVAELRRQYFSELDLHLSHDQASDVVVDKLPLNLVEAGRIQRIFPAARFIMVLRHPCDCVLSCFMQNFRLNDAMANFLDLEDTARLYDQAMTLWQQYRSRLPLAVHTVRYEELIADFEGTIDPLLGFLGVEWDEAVREYAVTARQRGRINTPSYSQVTEALYTRAQGRWERYREEMQPVLPLLQPWIERYGYG